MHIDELPDVDEAQWVGQIIGNKTREKIGRLKFTNDRKRSLGGQLLVRYALIRDKQFPKSQLLFDTYKNGKPFCKNYPMVHFNVSHSGLWVICAVSDSPIGIDIEKISNADMQVAERFFTKYEYEYLQQQGKNKAEAFYQLWTLKESYLKYTGDGLSVPLNSFGFVFEDEKIRFFGSQTGKICFLSQKVFDNYYLSVCTQKMHKELLIEQVTIEKIQEYLL